MVSADRAVWAQSARDLLEKWYAYWLEIWFGFSEMLSAFDGISRICLFIYLFVLSNHIPFIVNNKNLHVKTAVEPPVVKG
jgi:hypothetical protein